MATHFRAESIHPAQHRVLPYLDALARDDEVDDGAEQNCELINMTF